MRVTREGPTFVSRIGASIAGANQILASGLWQRESERNRQVKAAGRLRQVVRREIATTCPAFQRGSVPALTSESCATRCSTSASALPSTGPPAASIAVLGTAYGTVIGDQASYLNESDTRAR